MATHDETITQTSPPNEKFLDSPKGKALAVVCAVIALAVLVFAAVSSGAFKGSQDYGPQVSPQQSADEAQKAIDAIKKDPNLTDQQKTAAIAHYQAAIDQAGGKNANPNVGAPAKK